MADPYYATSSLQGNGILPARLSRLPLRFSGTALTVPAPATGAESVAQAVISEQSRELTRLNQQTNNVLKFLPAKDRMLTGLLHLKEQPSSYSGMKFIQDTGILWLPKVSIARSFTERFEVTFTEFIESAYFYFAAPLTAQNGFQGFFHKLAKQKPDPALLRTAWDKIPEAERRKVAPLKAAMVLSSVGAVSVAGEYALNFVKNIITAKGLHQSNFSDVVALSKPANKEDKKQQEVVNRAKRRIAQCATVSLGLLAGSVALARWGAALPNTFKVPALALGHLRTPKEIPNPVLWFAKTFDFNYGNPKKFGLTNPQLSTLIMPLAVLGYIDAARDKLERLEVTPRVILSGFYLAKGADMLEHWITTRARKKHPHLFNSDGSAKSLNEITDGAVHRAKSVLQEQFGTKSGQAPEELLYAKAAEIGRRDFAIKNGLFYPQYLFGILGVGLAVAWLNQRLTQHRFQQGVGMPGDTTLTTSAPRVTLPQVSGRTTKSPQTLSATVQPFPPPVPTLSATYPSLANGLVLGKEGDPAATWSAMSATPL